MQAINPVPITAIAIQNSGSKMSENVVQETDRFGFNMKNL